MPRLEGVRDLPQPPGEVGPRLRDARFLVRCVPGVESVKEVGADHAVCVLRPRLAFVQGTLELTLRVAPAPAGAGGRLFLHTKGIGSTSSVEAAWVLEPHEGGTRLSWAADVTELGGLLRAVPAGLVKAAAQKVIADAWAQAERLLREQANPSPI